MIQSIKKARPFTLVIKILHTILKRTKKIMTNKVIRKKSRCFNCNHKKSTFLKQNSGLKMLKPKTYRQYKNMQTYCLNCKNTLVIYAPKK